MTEVSKQIESSFDLVATCKKCGGKNVEIDFWAGFIHDCGGDVGSLRIECKSCGAKVECDDS